MKSSYVQCATAAGEAAVVDTIVLAFAADPMVRWCWRSSAEYCANMPAFTRAFGGNAFDHASAHFVENGVGAALWLPPEVRPDEDAMAQIVQRSVPEAVMSDLSVVIGQMAEHHPNEPHWYLPLLGVDPAHQGRGLGSALLSHALAQCDRDGIPAYLESSNPRNIPLYERHGFRAIGKIQVGSSPTLVPMLRPVGG